MSDDTLTRLPTPGVVLDLDAEERDPKDVKPPFIVNVSGRQVQLKDPSEIDWRELADVEVPGDLIRIATSREDRNFLHEQPLPVWKFNRLMDAYYTHYDLEKKIEDAKRRQRLAGS